MTIKSKIIGHFCFIIIIIILLAYKVKTEETNDNKILVIPFKSFLPKDNKIQDKINALTYSWVKRKIYLNINNESGQKIPMILTSEDIKMHTRDVLSVLKTDDEYYEPYNINVSDT